MIDLVEIQGNIREFFPEKLSFGNNSSYVSVMHMPQEFKQTLCLADNVSALKGCE